MFCPYKKQFSYIKPKTIVKIRTIRNLAERIEYQGDKIKVFDLITNKLIGEY